MSGATLVFGWSLDGQRASRPTDSLGTSVVGPLGFLTILETQLGLLALHPSQAERIVQYRDCCRSSILNNALITEAWRPIPWERPLVCSTGEINGSCMAGMARSLVNVSMQRARSRRHPLKCASGSQFRRAILSKTMPANVESSGYPVADFTN